MSDSELKLPKEFLDVFFPEIEHLRKVDKNLKNPKLTNDDRSKQLEEKKKLEDQIYHRLMKIITSNITENN